MTVYAKWTEAKITYTSDVKTDGTNVDATELQNQIAALAEDLFNKLSDSDKLFLQNGGSFKNVILVVPTTGTQNSTTRGIMNGLTSFANGKGYTLFNPMDITLTCTLSSNITDLLVKGTIKPEEVIIFRQHGSEYQELTTKVNIDGEYIAFSSDYKKLYLHVNKFSVYAIGVSTSKVTTTTTDATATTAAATVVSTQGNNAQAVAAGVDTGDTASINLIIDLLLLACSAIVCIYVIRTRKLER